eukprot:5143984-Karenia_brevis.AAC.1
MILPNVVHDLPAGFSSPALLFVGVDSDVGMLSPWAPPNIRPYCMQELIQNVQARADLQSWLLHLHAKILVRDCRHDGACWGSVLLDAFQDLWPQAASKDLLECQLDEQARAL